MSESSLEFNYLRRAEKILDEVFEERDYFVNYETNLQDVISNPSVKGSLYLLFEGKRYKQVSTSVEIEVIFKSLLKGEKNNFEKVVLPFNTLKGGRRGEIRQVSDNHLKKKLSKKLDALAKGLKNEIRAKEAAHHLTREEGPFYSWENSSQLEDIFEYADLWIVPEEGESRVGIQVKSSEGGLYAHWKDERAENPAVEIYQEIEFSKIVEKVKNAVIQYVEHNRTMTF